MIYIDENTTNIYIPRVQTEGEPTVWKITNQVSHEESTFEVLDISDNNTMYKFNISAYTASIEVGQYDYEVLDENNDVLYSGIMQFGDYAPAEPVAHNVENNIIQYNG